MKPTMVNFKRKVLNDSFIDTSIRVVETNGRIYAWNPAKRNIILLEIKKVRVNVLYFAPPRFSRQE